jgi:hypothetical protein
VRRLAAGLVVLAVAPLLTACGSGSANSCIALEASPSPTPIVAGAHVTVDVTGAIAVCGDAGGETVPKDEVTVRLVAAAGGAIVAEATAPVRDFDATVEIDVDPGAAPGIYELWVDNDRLQDVQIEAP